MSDYLSNNLQENLLTLLSFDDDAVKMLRFNLEEEHFENIFYRNIFRRIVNHFDAFKEAPKQHLPDICEDYLTSDDKDSSGFYEDIINNLYSAHKDGLNKKFIISQVNTFIKRQSIKLGTIEVAKLVQANKLDEAEIVLREMTSKRISVFDGGLNMMDTDRVLKFFDIMDNFYPLGIPELDKRGVCPAPEELFTFISDSSKGKSWFLTHIAKVCAIGLRKKILHISLEMSEERVAQRYVQSILGAAKTNNKIIVPSFEKDKNGELTNITIESREPAISLSSTNAIKIVEKKLKKFRRLPIKVKRYPTSSFTITELRAFLENLVAFENFIPHILLLDYPALMKTNNTRDRYDLVLSGLYQELRGIAVEYNCAVVVVSQTNRSGEDSRWLKKSHIADADGKFRISDNLVSYNQTDEEMVYGLARLHVLKGRNDRRGDKILISQNYDTGQFCLDSVLLRDAEKDVLDYLIDR